MNKRIFSILVTAAVSAASAFAVDGQILINAAAVKAQGGYPYMITQAGSYKLSGNLNAPTNTPAIDIEADDVTVDLNGFTISGLSTINVRTAPPSAVLVNGARALITNGVIDGFFSLWTGTATDVTLQGIRSAIPAAPTVSNNLDQARLTASGGSISITQSGKYQLTSNITGPGAGFAAYSCLIYLNAPNVTLDLAGFTLQVTALNPPILTGPNAKNLIVRNGIISSTEVPNLIVLPLIAPSSGAGVSYLVMEDLTLDGPFLQGLTAPYFVDRVVGPSANLFTTGNACPGVVSNSMFHFLQGTCPTGGQ